ncbi:MAG: serine/threonine protein kinase [Pirellulaceae bacterium]|nr:serine/threonine protein kinase [Pirellulaceae bacterium]
MIKLKLETDGLNRLNVFLLFFLSSVCGFVDRVAKKKRPLQESVLLSGLVTSDDLDRAVISLQDESDGPLVQSGLYDQKQLADQLVKMKLLTRYQAEQLESGRTKLNLGPYIVTDFIGQGGMGQVFKAQHQIMRRDVALKVLPLNKSNPDSILNFHQEIRTQAQLDHENLVRAFDAGQDGNVHYLVTEYIPGTDLRRLVRFEGALSEQQAADIVFQAAMGLSHAHQMGLIHRDIKPGNILVTPEGVAKVSDLGLAGFIDNQQEEDRRAGKIVGTADYLSPEQIKTPDKVTSASDIYSLGCTLYYAITGKVPFPGGSSKDKARRHCEQAPWHPRRFAPEVSEEFVEIIADMMEKSIDKRIVSAEEVANRLEPWTSQSDLLPLQQLRSSPWSLPPLPVDFDGSGPEEDLPETMPEDSEWEKPGFHASEELSQGTLSVKSAEYETRDSESSSLQISEEGASREELKLSSDQNSSLEVLSGSRAEISAGDIKQELQGVDASDGKASYATPSTLLPTILLTAVIAFTLGISVGALAMMLFQ